MSKATYKQKREMEDLILTYSFHLREGERVWLEDWDHHKVARLTDPTLNYRHSAQVAKDLGFKVIVNNKLAKREAEREELDVELGYLRTAVKGLLDSNDINTNRLEQQGKILNRLSKKVEAVEHWMDENLNRAKSDG